MSHRIGYIDTAKGICIMLVVAYHCNLHPSMRIDNMLSCIRMPLYFFLSGLFFKQYEGYLPFIKRKVNKLLIPFFFFYLVTSVLLPNVLHTFFSYPIYTVTGWASLYAFIYPEVFPNIPIWFLWSLFCANTLFYALVLLGQKTSMSITYILAVIIGIAGFLLKCFSIDGIAFMNNTFFYFPFFISGYIFNKFKQSHSIHFSKPTLLTISLLVLIAFYFISNITTNDLWINMMAFYIACLLGISLITMLSSVVGTIPFITYFGKYSIMLLLTHCLVLQIFLKIFVLTGYSETITNLLTFIFTMMSYLLFIPLMKKYLPYVTAQKNVIYV